MSNDQPIQVEDASLSTVSIEVKVLRIGKKQMTLAVFRQLPERPIIDETGALRGTPWGHINYHQDCQEGEHLHVIWQDGNLLCRNIVPRTSARENMLIERVYDLADAWLHGAALAGWRPGPEHKWTPAQASRGSGMLAMKMHGVSLVLRPELSLSQVLNDRAVLAEAEKLDEKNHAHAVAAHEEYLQGIEPQLRSRMEPPKTEVEKATSYIAHCRRDVEHAWTRSAQGLDYEGVQAALKVAAEAYTSYATAYETTYNRLAALDQLFIAV